MRSEAVFRKTVFCVVTPCSLADRYQRFTEGSAFILQLRQQEPLKRWQQPAGLQGVKCRKTVNLYAYTSQKTLCIHP
jgi:hypothetical protein